MHKCTILIDPTLSEEREKIELYNNPKIHRQRVSFLYKDSQTAVKLVSEFLSFGLN